MYMNKYQIDFISQIMKFKIDETGLATTPACHVLSKKMARANVRLSHMTLIKASKGEFTMRTVRLMISAGWFAIDEFLGKKTQPNQSKPKTDTNSNSSNSKVNVTAEFENKFKALIQEAFDKGYQSGISSSKDSVDSWRKEIYRNGYTDGFKKGQDAGRSEISSGVKDRTKAYNDGYDRGKAVGTQEGYSRGYQEGKKARRPASRVETLSVDTAKLRGLFELSKRGATDGEKIAARTAVGVILSKWILSEYGDSVKVSVV